MVALEKSPCVRSRIAATCSSWYGLERLSECPITSRVADAEAVLQPARERERGADHRPAAHDVGVRDADVLDADRRVVEADRVAAAPLQRHELADRPVAVDQEVRADARALAELDVGRVGRERVPRRAVRRARRVVLDDHLRVAQPRDRRAVVALGVGAHLRLARIAERDPVPLDRRLGRARLRRRAGTRRSATSSTARAWRRTDRRGSAARGQLDHERARLGVAVVLPARHRAAVVGQPPGREPDAAAVGADDRVAPGALERHEPHVLVVVERHRRVDLLDQPLHRPRLRLARRPRPGK